MKCVRLAMLYSTRHLMTHLAVCADFAQTKLPATQVFRAVRHCMHGCRDYNAMRQWAGGNFEVFDKAQVVLMVVMDDMAKRRLDFGLAVDL